VQVATELGCERHTVGRWRQRYLAHGLAGLQDAPRSGRPRRISPLRASRCAVASDPETSHLPLSSHPLESR
jgi:transposase